MRSSSSIHIRRRWRAAGSIVLLAALAACGGGGGGSAAEPGGAGSLASSLGATDGTTGAATGASGVPMAAQLQGGEFTLNRATAGDQGRAAAVALPGGGFVAVWSSNATGASEVRMQRFAADGRP